MSAAFDLLRRRYYEEAGSFLQSLSDQSLGRLVSDDLSIIVAMVNFLLFLAIRRSPLSMNRLLGAVILVLLRGELEHSDEALAPHRYRKHIRASRPSLPLLARSSLPAPEPVLLLLRHPLRLYLPQQGPAALLLFLHDRLHLSRPNQQFT